MSKPSARPLPAQPLVIATKPPKLPFIHITIEKLGSPVRRSSMYKLVNNAATPPAAPDKAVLTAAWAAFLPTWSTSNNNALPLLKEKIKKLCC